MCMYVCVCVCRALKMEAPEQCSLLSELPSCEAASRTELRAARKQLEQLQSAMQQLDALAAATDTALPSAVNVSVNTAMMNESMMADSRFRVSVYFSTHTHTHTQ